MYKRRLEFGRFSIQGPVTVSQYEKFFGLWKGGPNDSECFDSPKSNIVKNTFFEKKTLKFFILLDFYAKRGPNRQS